MDRVDELLKKLEKRRGNEWLRHIRALGEAGDTRAVEPLCRILSEGRAANRREAANALGKIGNPKAVEVLTEALQDREAEVCLQAVEALGKIGEAGLEPLIDELDDTLLAIRFKILDAFSGLQDPRIAEPLARRVMFDEFEDIRDRAFDILQASGLPATPYFSKVLSDRLESIEARIHAIRALEKLGGKDAVKALADALTSDSEAVRVQAVDALGRLAHPSTLDKLIGMLKDKDDTVRVQVVDALKQFDSPAVPDALNPMLEDPSPYVRYAAAMELGKTGDRRVLEPLYQMVLNKESGWQGAALGLAEFGDARAVEPLVHLSSDDATEGLKKIQPHLKSKNRNYFCERCNVYAELYTPNLDIVPYSGWNPILMLQYVVASIKKTVVKGYFVCKKCRGNLFFREGIKKVELRMDRGMKEVMKEVALNDEAGGTCLVMNWYKWKGDLFDYDEIQVVDADEYDIEQLVIRLGNDIDGKRRGRKPYIPLFLSKKIELPLSKMNMLEDNFKLQSTRI